MTINHKQTIETTMSICSYENCDKSVKDGELCVTHIDAQKEKSDTIFVSDEEEEDWEGEDWEGEDFDENDDCDYTCDDIYDMYYNSMVHR